MPSPIVWNPCISPPILLDSHIEVRNMGKVVVKQLRDIVEKTHREWKVQGTKPELRTMEQSVGLIRRLEMAFPKWIS
jgi:hypothetical protein